MGRNEFIDGFLRLLREYEEERKKKVRGSQNQ